MSPNDNMNLKSISGRLQMLACPVQSSCCHALSCVVVVLCYRESIAVLRNEPFGSLIIGSCKGWFVSGSFLHSLLMDKVLDG